MKKQPIKNLGMSAEYKGLVDVYVNDNTYTFVSNAPVQSVINVLSKDFEVSKSDEYDIKVMW